MRRLLLLILCLTLPVAGVRTILAGGEEDCIVVRAAPKAEVIVSYEALPDENAKVRVTVTKQQFMPDNTPGKPAKRIRSLVPARTGQLNLTSESFANSETHYTTCFLNIARNAAIELVFSVRADAYEHLHDVATQQHAEGLRHAISRLSQDTKQLLQQQDFTVARERAHRVAMSSTHSRILKWTMVQAGFLALLAGAQVLYIKRLFQSPKTIL